MLRRRSTKVGVLVLGILVFKRLQAKVADYL